MEEAQRELLSHPLLDLLSQALDQMLSQEVTELIAWILGVAFHLCERGGLLHASLAHQHVDGVFEGHPTAV